MKRSHCSDRQTRIVRRDGNVKRFRHCRNLASLRNSTGVTDIGLNHIDRAVSKKIDIRKSRE